MYAMIRQRAKETELPPLSIHKLDAALSNESKKKARGLVQVSPTDVGRLPIAGKQELLDFFNGCEHRAAWPWQFWAIAIGLIPKKIGDRGLGIMPWLARLWARLRSDGLNEWVEKSADPWDHAVAGSSALRHALRRDFLDETATAAGACAASLLWYVKEFFDCISLTRVMHAALEYGFPPVELALLFIEHMAPRLLRIRGAYAQPIYPHRSAVARCRGAQQFARIVMKRILHIVHHEFHPIVSSEAWVDDVNQRSQRTREIVVEQTSRAGIMFGKGVEALGLTIADKSRCIANQPGVAEEIVTIVNASGLPVRAADVSPDLGIDRGRRVATRKPTHEKR